MPPIQLAVVVGVDLIRVDEVATSIRRFGERYTHRIFTPDEITYCSREPHLADERFAARFAAKEATIKVLRVGPSDALDWRSIELRRSPEGWVDIVLHGAAEALAARAGISDLSLSMSHEGEFATATVVAIRGRHASH